MSSLTVPTQPRRDGGSLAGRRDGPRDRREGPRAGACRATDRRRKLWRGASSFGSSRVLAAGNHDPREARARMSATQKRRRAMAAGLVSWLGRRGATGKRH
jgi:hypothetical protein